MTKESKFTSALKRAGNEAKQLRDALISDVHFRVAVTIHLEDVEAGLTEYCVEWGVLRPDIATVQALLNETAVDVNYEHGLARIKEIYNAEKAQRAAQAFKQFETKALVKHDDPIA